VERHAQAATAGSSRRRIGGRLQLVLIALAAVVFLLVPAAQAFASAPLRAGLAGTGTGAVTTDKGEPPLNCSGPPPTGICESIIKGSGLVTYTATADLGSEFTGWTIDEGETLEEALEEPGNCSEASAGECTMVFNAVIGSQPTKVTAHFSSGPSKFKLTVTKSGTGSGTVTGGSVAEPSTINCGSGSGCEHEYTEGAVVTLSKAADPGSEFKKWTGACSGSGTCEVTMSAAKSVGAEFAAIRSLAITPGGTGTGTVQCEVNGGGAEACASSYPEGTSVKLKATANGGSEFAGYSGDCTGPTCELTMNANKSVTATFNLVGEKSFTITKNGTGTGTVQCEVNLGPAEACASSYPEGTSVKLKATPNAGSEFAGYSGDCTGPTCELTMNANKSVTATFNLIPTLAITKAGTGTGEVKCEVNSGPSEACASSYPKGTGLKVTAFANSGSEFKGFSAGTGSASACTTSPCSFTIEAASSLTATFDLIPRTLSVTNAGTGTGVVKCKVNGGSEETCPATVPNGKSVQVIATANSGSEFKGFSAGTGSASSCSTSPCTFTIEANSSLTATFDLIPRTLTITKAGTGTGEVKCKVGAGPEEACAASYPNGSSVKVIATPSEGSEFSAFSGNCVGATCTLNMTANKSVTVTFNLIARTLTIVKAGTGSGTVTCNGGGCAASYPDGTTVTLAASAASGSTFAGWSGGGCSGTGNCVVTLKANTTVTATFDTQSSDGGGGSTPPPAPAPAPAPPPAPKPLKCKKGFKKKTVKGKARCVKVKKHKHRRH
jgi:Divergent InlB B-repeat domain